MLGNTSPANTPRSQRKTWFLLGGIAAVAVMSGLILPRSLPTTLPTAPAATAPTTPAAPTAGAQTTPAAGKTDLTYTAPSWPEPPDPRPLLLRLGVGTVFVLGLCVSSLWVAKRWLRGPVAPVGGTSQLRLVETLMLGNRCALYLVTAGERSILVGADAAGLKSIMALTDGFADALAKAGHDETVAGLLKDSPALPAAATH